MLYKFKTKHIPYVSSLGTSINDYARNLYFFRLIKINFFIFKKLFIKKVIKIRIRIEDFVGYKFWEVQNALSLTSFILILNKLLGYVFFNILISPIISYLLLINFTLTFLILESYYYYQEYFLIPLIKELLGDHYLHSSLDQITDDDERAQWNYPDNFFGKMHFKTNLLFFPFFRKLHFYLIYFRLILVNNPFVSRIFIFCLFQFLIFNKFLYFCCFFSLFLNISRNLFIVSDFSISNLVNEIYRIYNVKIHLINHKFVAFWTFRGIFYRAIYIDTINKIPGSKGSIQHVNSTLGKTYLRNKILHHNLIIKRTFTKQKFVGLLKLNSNLVQTFSKENNIQNQVQSAFFKPLQKHVASCSQEYLSNGNLKTSFNILYSEKNNMQGYKNLGSATVCQNMNANYMHGTSISFDKTPKFLQEQILDNIITTEQSSGIALLLKNPQCIENIKTHLENNMDNEINMNLVQHLSHTNVNFSASDLGNESQEIINKNIVLDSYGKATPASKAYQKEYLNKINNLKIEQETISNPINDPLKEYKLWKSNKDKLNDIVDS